MRLPPGERSLVGVSPKSAAIELVARGGFEPPMLEAQGFSTQLTPLLSYGKDWPTMLMSPAGFLATQPRFYY